MKNLKVLALVMVLVMAIGALAACGPKTEPVTTPEPTPPVVEPTPTPEPVVVGFKDGVYKASQEAADQYGWKGFVEIEVKDGKIATVTFDYDNAGKLKSEDAGYKAAMEPVSKTYPEKAFAELEAALIEKQDITAVDAVAGATTSSTEFAALVNTALATAK